MPTPTPPRPHRNQQELIPAPPAGPCSDSPNSQHEYEPNSVEMGDCGVLFFSCSWCGCEGTVELPEDRIDWHDDEEEIETPGA